MTAARGGAERRPRLNPFAFPSDTTFRFGLLVAAVFGANLYVWQWIASTSTGRSTRGALECLAPATSAEASTLVGTRRSTRCVDALYRYQVGWMLGGTGAPARRAAD